MKFIIEENRIFLKNQANSVIAELNFHTLDDGNLSIDRTFVDSSLRGQGIADKLMYTLIDIIKERKVKAKPVCSYAINWFEKNESYKNLLA